MADSKSSDSTPAASTVTQGASLAPGETFPEDTGNILASAVGAGRPSATGLSGKEEQQLADLQAKARSAQLTEGGGTVQMKTEPPHSHFTFGNVTVGPDWTDVPAYRVGGLEQAALSAGVTLTQKG